MSKRKRIIALIVGLFTLGGVGIASAGFFGHHHGRHMSAEKVKKFVDWRMDAMLSELDASDDQRAQIKGLADELFEAVKPQFEGRKATRELVMAQLTAEKPDAKALHALVDERIEAMRALAHQAVDAGVEAHGVLTPAQRTQLAELIRERHGEK
ncbi:MAG: Spy/CpxP family protein refolding chaperone [Myxococcales bacterium]|nr:Spy/CpxP family protein refolding chaperone [Myxococcales bacterium]MCB9523881.1 Spy/CpxP family protein refolding chaperone [Myxococcales bacterium]